MHKYKRLTFIDDITYTIYKKIFTPFRKKNNGNKNSKKHFIQKRNNSMQTRSGWYRRKGQVCRTSIKLNKPLPYKRT